MKKVLLICFTAACLIILMIPSVFMIWAPSTQTIGNESRKSAPAITNEDGSFNQDILKDAGEYFEQNYSFRSALITADAKIQSTVFGVSNTDSIIVGSDGWLYYNSTLKDYLGNSQLTDRGMFNLAHNLSLAEAYVNAKGAKFLFISPPNKNTLYPENMPYYYQTGTGDETNRNRLAAYLEKTGVSYLDLYSLLGGLDETIYLKQDSHWNNKGAMLVYNNVLSVLGKEHDTYEDAGVEYECIHAGDLSAMIYPADDTLEADYQYDYEVNYSYVPTAANSDPVSVEDPRIETVNDNAVDTLVMYRDSFGNTLLPLMANSFSNAYFSKGVPYTIAKDMETYSPQYVVIELVERNLANLAKIPAVVPGARVKISAQEMTSVNCETDIAKCTADASYIAFSGVIEEKIPDEARIYLEISNDTSSNIYEAFTVTTDESDYGYLLYLPESVFGSVENAQKLTVRVYYR